jgi:hypothetical protein
MRRGLTISGGHGQQATGFRFSIIHTGARLLAAAACPRSMVQGFGRASGVRGREINRE